MLVAVMGTLFVLSTIMVLYTSIAYQDLCFTDQKLRLVSHGYAALASTSQSASCEEASSGPPTPTTHERPSAGTTTGNSKLVAGHCTYVDSCEFAFMASLSHRVIDVMCFSEYIVL